MISLHTQFSESPRLQDVYRVLNEDDDNKSDVYKYYFAIEVPQDTAARGAFLDRLLVLFQNGLWAARENSQVERHILIPRSNPSEIDSADMYFIMNRIRRALPLVDDPAFVQIITDKEAGLMRLMGSLINYQQRGGDASDTIRMVIRTTGDLQHEDKRVVPPNEMSWEKRREAMKYNVQYTDECGRTAEFRDKNIAFKADLGVKAGEAGIRGEYDSLVETLEKTTMQHAPGPFSVMQWRHVLLNKLAKLDLKGDGVATKFSALTGAMGSATTAEGLMNAIDGF
jgi:hypothetical protein